MKFDNHFFEDLSKKLADAVPENVKTMRNDMEKHFRQIIQTVFTKMDLITREEFDIQVMILSKTRGKIEKLEEKIKELEKNLSVKKQKTEKK
jgi:BMFP domain-containing protein YqiC